MVGDTGSWLSDNFVGLLAIVLTILLAIDTRRRLNQLDSSRHAEDVRRREVRESLAGFIAEGDDVISQTTSALTTIVGRTRSGDVLHGKDSIARAADAHEKWVAKVSDSLRDNEALGAEYEHRFRAQVPGVDFFPAEPSSERSAAANQALIRARQDRLKEFIAEFRADNGTVDMPRGTRLVSMKPRMAIVFSIEDRDRRRDRDWTWHPLIPVSSRERSSSQSYATEGISGPTST
jgi:hypothetical protein